jgi:DNA-binding SARP family transcriptional activator/streptogramin lyase
VKYRILGPLVLGNGTAPVSLDAPKQRALLGVLLLHPNETISSERLIDELWGERPPATATKVLQTYVSQLRRRVGADTIATRPPGYLLRVDEDALDATQFRRLFAEGRGLAAAGDHHGATERYREALALWRGPPLADVVFESFARNEVAQLEEERLSAVMDLIDSELALGRHAQVLHELEPLVRQYPLHERLRAQLMLALYRSGRQADALAAYRDARRTLVEELGLEPGRELQELEKAILAHDPGVDAPPLPPPRVAARGPRSRLPLRAVGAVVLAAVAVAAVLAFALGSNHSSALALAPNTVGFIDAQSGEVTRSFAVGRSPRALEVTNDSIWVANGRDRTVTRIRRNGGEIATIPVGAHPTGIVAYGDRVWVSTVEGTVVPIDPRFDNTLRPVALQLGAYGQGLRTAGIAAGGGSLWVTAPGAIVVRVNADEPRQQSVIIPDSGARGPITFHDGAAWVGGSSNVFPIDAESAIEGDSIAVGGVRGLTFGAGSLWVTSGGPGHIGDVKQALRRIDTDSRLIETTIPVGAEPIAVTATAGAVWVASESDRAITRVDPSQDRVVDTVRLGSVPTALAAAENGVWVTTRR